MKVKITPAMAKRFLERNDHNRALRQNFVIFLAEEITADRWDWNGQTIVFGKGGMERGRLLDGQHRLEACVLANLPIDTEVVEGVDDEAFKTIDQGISRSAADVLRLDGLPEGVNSLQLSATIRALLNHIHGRNERSRGSATEISAFYQANPRIGELVAQANKVRVLPTSPLASIGFLATETKARYPQWNEFLDGLTEGVGLAKDDPRLALRTFAFNQRHASDGQGFKRSKVMAAVAQAWNAYAQGKSLVKIRFTKTKLGRIIIPDIYGQRTRVEEPMEEAA